MAATKAEIKHQQDLHFTMAGSTVTQNMSLKQTETLLYYQYYRFYQTFYDNVISYSQCVHCTDKALISLSIDQI